MYDGLKKLLPNMGSYVIIKIVIILKIAKEEGAKTC